MAINYGSLNVPSCARWCGDCDGAYFLPGPPWRRKVEHAFRSIEKSRMLLVECPEVMITLSSL